MVNKRYYWLKLKVGFFNDLRIKKLRKIAGGDTYTVIYLKLLLSSLEENGYIFYEGVEKKFTDEIALKIDEDTDNVEVTVNYLLSQGLMEYREEKGCIYFNELSEITGSETASTRRSRLSRNRKKGQEVLQCNKNATAEIRDKSIDIRYISTKVLCSGRKNHDTPRKRLPKTKKNASKNKITSKQKISIENQEKYDLKNDLELHEKKDLELQAKNKKSNTGKKYDKIIQAWNEIEELPRVLRISTGTKRAKQLNARLKEYGEETVLQAIRLVSESDFLKGKTSSNGWTATFDWVIKPSNFIKVLEENYKNKDLGGQKNELGRNGIEFKKGYAETKSEKYYKNKYKL